LLKSYRSARRRLLLFDYDGSLVPFNEDYRQATPPKSLISLVSNLASDNSNEIVIISGRTSRDLENWFGNLPVNLVAEHGAAIKKTGADRWQTINADTAWKTLLKPSLDKYAKLAPGAKVEEKPHSLVWHYRTVAPYYAQKYTVIIKRVFRPIVKEYGLELLQGNKALEIKNPKVGKDVAAQRWLKKNYDFILAIGDDMTDEDLFAVLPYEAYSVKVGRGRTAARYRLGSYKEVLALLKKFAKV
jgi:trehalose 6-phosphate synthase/phosphatase